MVVHSGRSNAISQILMAHILLTAGLLLMKHDAANYHPKTTHHDKVYLDPATLDKLSSIISVYWQVWWIYSNAISPTALNCQ